MPCKFVVLCFVVSSDKRLKLLEIKSVRYHPYSVMNIIRLRANTKSRG